MIVWPEELKSAGTAENETALKDKYEKFNQEVAMQEERVNEVLKLADTLISSGHGDKITIMRRREV